MGPSFYPIPDGSEEARRIDDILRTVHHLVGVHDSEMEALAHEFANADYVVDERDAFFLDQEEAICGSLHTRAQKPKGCAYTRKHQRRLRQSKERAGQLSARDRASGSLLSKFKPGYPCILARHRHEASSNRA